MSWASRRRSTYLGIVFIIIIALLAGLFFLFFNKPPTCADGKQNGEEQGIDCGGLCEKVCKTQIVDLVLLWSRSFKVSDGIYNSVAYVENPNSKAQVSEISYTLKLFDNQNILVAERKGKTFISPGGITPIFEGGISTGQRLPVRTFFELSEIPKWSQVYDDKSPISVSEIKLSREDSSPRIDAILSNSSVRDISDIEVVAVVFDAIGNAIAVSATFIDLLSNRSSQNIVFTWPNKFNSPVSRIEIIPRAPIK
jgi:hypothetical protein